MRLPDVNLAIYIYDLSSGFREPTKYMRQSKHRLEVYDITAEFRQFVASSQDYIPRPLMLQ